MKQRLRYHYALRFARAKLANADASMRELPLTSSHPVVLEAVSRYRLQLPQVRRLVSQLRKDRDE